MTDLTDEQCNEFRRLPVGFNDMVRAIWKAGYKHGAWAAYPSAPAGQAEGAVKLAEDVIDALEDWAGYASDYFKQKHRYHEEMAEYRTRLEALATPQPPAQSAVTNAQIEAIGAKIYGTCFTPADRQFAMEVLALASSAQAGERDRLRAEQAAAVMPLIGPLLDAWVGMDNDTKATIREQAPDVRRWMNSIHRAMEAQADQPLEGHAKC